MSPDRGVLSAELERLCLHALRQEWQGLNARFFARRLRVPAFALRDAGGKLGQWVSAHRTIELSRALLTDHGWGQLIEVLKHEVAHQYVDEVLGLREQGAHGPAFQRVCAERGFDGRAAGVPAAAHGVEDDEALGRLLDRVAKLLALAGSPNVHEAEAAMNAAQRLMLKHNLAAVQARRGFEYRHLGRPTGRVGEAMRFLAMILAEHFFVEVIFVPVWRPLEGKRGTVLEVCGTRENVALAEYVHDFLDHTAEGLWREHRLRYRIRGNAHRRAFVAGTMAGFREKLAEERTVTEAQGLVWVGDPELTRFYRARHPHVRRRQHAGTAHREAHAHGRAAGRRIVLRRGVAAAPGSRGEVRLLGDGESGRN